MLGWQAACGGRNSSSPQILTFSSSGLKNKTFLEGKSREQLQGVFSDATGAGCHSRWALWVLFGGSCPRKVTRVGDGTMCQPQPRLCSLGILCWKHILRAHPINGFLQEKEQGPG